MTPGTEPESAVVTLLFCDLVGSTELLTTLGDDANDEVRRSLLSALEQEVQRHGGTVVKSMGDGMMVSFRTSAADAVACAIAIQRAALSVERNGVPLGLQLRVGISSGEASHEQGDWFGTPVVEAARLEAAARAGQILVSEVVRSIVGTRGGTEFRPAGKRELKGFAQPVPVIEVVWRDESTPRPMQRKPKKSKRPRMLVAGAALVVVAGAAFVLLRDSGGDARKEAVIVPLVANGYTPVLEPRDCPPVSGSEQTDIRCYDLVVPEDRKAPTGRQVRVPLLIIPSTTSNPGAPTVVLGVDFGGGGLAMSAVREYGDTVIFGIRGGDFATPSLTCPEITNAVPQILALPQFDAAANKLYLDGADACGKRLVSEGVDLDAYGLDDTADDVRDLVIASGWHEINMEAHWQWTRIPNILAARFPGLVRAAVLADPGNVPVDIGAYNEAFQAFLASCHADVVCDTAFPDLETFYSDQYAALELQPWVVTTQHPFGGSPLQIVIDGDASVVIMLLALQVVGPGPVTVTVHADPAHQGSIMAAFIAEHVDLNPSLPWSYGQFNSEYCEDEYRAVVRTGVEVGIARFPLYAGIARDPAFELCSRWPTKQRSAVVDSLPPADPPPALIVTGAINPYAPASYAKRAATQFKQATVAAFPTLAAFALLNGPPCVAELRLAFLRDPHAKLDVEGCIASVPPIEWQGT
jgi:class 3 adenylate cyclase